MKNDVWEGGVRKKKLKSIPLLFSPLSIDELAADVRAQLVAKLPKADYFALQLDESTDVSNDPQLLAFVWLSTKMRCRRNLYCLSSCMDVQKSSEIFKVIDNFFLEHDIPWPKCVAMCTDGARAMCDALNAS